MLRVVVMEGSSTLTFYLGNPTQPAQAARVVTLAASLTSPRVSLRRGSAGEY